LSSASVFLAFYISSPVSGHATDHPFIGRRHPLRPARRRGLEVMTARNRPIVRSAAIVSNLSLNRAAIGMIALFSRRKLDVFDSRPQALDSLATQR
jgi:hypothetical protein